MKFRANGEVVTFELQIPFNAELARIRKRRSLAMEHNFHPATNIVGEADMAWLVIGAYYAVRQAVIVGKAIIAPFFGQEQIFADEQQLAQVYELKPRQT